MHDITPVEHDLIMAGLRMLQKAIVADNMTEDIKALATNAGGHAMPTDEAIDELHTTRWMVFSVRGSKLIHSRNCTRSGAAIPFQSPHRLPTCRAPNRGGG